MSCYLFHKQLDMHGCVISTAATDVLALKHQAIIIHSTGTDLEFILLPNTHTKILYLQHVQTTQETKIIFWKKNDSVV